ncbi:hypothetical protein PINS_up009131 [Pythium insidiosum]|nr:hypothetical protein PINS_up009131 [Pythium insidiosum]
MLQDLKSVEPQFLSDYKQELQHKFHRQVVFQSPRVTVLDSFLDGLPPSRCFVFNDRPHLVQSEMLLGDDAPLDPSRLVLDVHQAMALALRWLAPTLCRRVAVLGSGGGSLARYVLHHAPSLERLDAVEPDAVVNDVARQFFGLDDTADARVRVHESMGEAFVEQQLEVVGHQPEHRYDLVLLDVEGGDDPSSEGVTAPPSTMLVPSFLENVRRLIAPQHGVLVVNVIAENDSALARVARAFHDALQQQLPHGFVLRLPRNTVLFWLGDAPELSELTHDELRQRLVDMVPVSSRKNGSDGMTQWDVSTLCRVEDVINRQ